MQAAKSKRTIFAVIGLAVAVAVAVGGYLYIQSNSESKKREKDPESYVNAALSKTYGLINMPSYDSGWLFDILGGRHQLEFGIGIKDFDMGVDLPVNPQIMSMLQLGRLNLSTVRDTNTRQMSAEVTAMAGGVSVLSADLYMADDELAIRIPQGYNFFITVNPQTAITDWDSSVLGLVNKFSPMISDGQFFDAYKNVFQSVKKPAKLVLTNRKPLLLEGAEYGFVGGDKEIYDYTLTIKADKFNEWYNLTADDIAGHEFFEKSGLDKNTLHNFSVDSDVKIELHVEEDVIKAANITTSLPGGVSFAAQIALEGEANIFDDIMVDITMENPQGGAARQAGKFDISQAVSSYVMLDEMPKRVSISANIQGDAAKPGYSKANIILSGDEVGSMEIIWDYSWDKDEASLDNFKLNAAVAITDGEKTGRQELSVTGNVLENRDSKEFLANFSSIKYSLIDFDENENKLELDLKYNIRAVEDEITYDKGGAVAIGKLSPIQLMQIYAKFSSDAVIGNLIKGM